MPVQPPLMAMVPGAENLTPAQITGVEILLLAGVTPQNVQITLDTLSAWLVASGIGGNPKLEIAGAAVNGKIGALPANASILYALFRNTAGSTVNVSIGRTLGASDVMSAAPVVAGGQLNATTLSFDGADWFSATLSQDLYLTLSAQSVASINAWIVYQVGP